MKLAAMILLASTLTPSYALAQQEQAYNREVLPSGITFSTTPQPGMYRISMLRSVVNSSGSTRDLSFVTHLSINGADMGDLYTPQLQNVTRNNCGTLGQPLVCPAGNCSGRFGSYSYCFVWQPPYDGCACSGGVRWDFEAYLLDGDLVGAYVVAYPGSDPELHTQDDFAQVTFNPGLAGPGGLGGASPADAFRGGSTLLSVSVSPGVQPPSTGLTVIADLGLIGLSSAQDFFDDGTNGDATPGDLVFSYLAFIDFGAAVGPRSLPFTVSDAQSRTSSATITLSVLHPPMCCQSDFDGDGDIGTDHDIEAFFACLAGNCCPTCPADADFNCDGDAGTDADIESFFRILAGGPC
jgi:hypothetical protein